ncbi:peptide chain release factor N(5)-glutamine methyltransferase [Oceanispirochaeta crateris]|uniref:Release factor glutamine methyltransferase n=1 Tax=Oceanispirochaeta crateris TaxID=2518645 RepID=A0A5C1QG52_9SPIO|nr:peptide chain release factor N(5)-glutamine methyltransferase [Oceanispirochaeta crateris]QEN07045.1 peptide chain release factor N(5)-glutamine methyltransferase [Oceanispirochaeta crateris]
MTSTQNIIIRDALQEGSQRLIESESPWLDATLLLGCVTKQSREKIMASYPDSIELEVYSSYMSLIEKRAEGYPVAYLTGIKEFFGRDFHVTPGILCPRPDTEILIEEALKQVHDRAYKRVHDLCTGSGCIALTLKLENPDLQVSASDLSPVSEKVFELNRKNLENKDVKFTLSSLLEDIGPPLDLIVSNPPYLTSQETDERINRNWKEPSLALDGGEDGLDLIRIIIKDAPPLLNEGGMLMIEADPRQMDEMEQLMKKAGFENIKKICDLASHERVIMGNLK